MRQLSSAVIEKMKQNADFYATASIKFADGETVFVEKDGLFLGSNVTYGAGLSAFPYGIVIPKVCTLLLVNYDERWGEYYFTGAKIEVYSNIDFDDGSTDTMLLGTFTVIEPEAYGDTIELSAVDDSYKLDIKYNTNLKMPATVSALLDEVAKKTGINIISDDFDNKYFEIRSVQKDVTARQVLEGICGIVGCNGLFDENNNFKLVHSDKFSMYINKDGGSFGKTFVYEDVLSPYLNTQIGMTSYSNLKPYYSNIDGTTIKARYFTPPKTFSLYGMQTDAILITQTNVVGFPLDENDLFPVSFILYDSSGRISEYRPSSYQYFQIITNGNDNIVKIRLRERGSTSDYAEHYVELFFLGNSDIVCNYYKGWSVINGKLIYRTGEKDENGQYLEKEIDLIPGIHVLSSNGGKDLHYRDDDELYEDGYSLNGGGFLEWDDLNNIDAGSLLTDVAVIEPEDININSKTDYGTATITSVSIDTKNGDLYAVGSVSGYEVKIDNVLKEDIEDEIVNIAGEKLIGAEFKPFSVDIIPNPYYEVMDAVLFVDKKTKTSVSIITDIEYSFSGPTSIKCSADPPMRAGKFWTSNTSNSLAAAVNNLDAKIDDVRENEDTYGVLDLLSNSMGLFTSKEFPQGGGSILYMHDKPTRAESKYIWRNDGASFRVSSDGGQTWTGGFDAAGNAVLQNLAVTGLLFDWAKGGTISLGGLNDSIGVLKVLNEIGSTIAKISSIGFTAYHEDASINVGGNRITWINNSESVGYISHVSFSNNRHGIEAIADTYTKGSAQAFVGFGYSTGINSARSVLLASDAIPSFWSTQPDEYRPQVKISDHVEIGGRLEIRGDLISHGYKSRAVETENYNTVALQAYETPSPMFGDVGRGVTDESGECIIFIDPVFREIIAKTQYHVFLQKECAGDVFVSKRENDYFIVKGDPGIVFSWEIKGYQKNYECFRNESPYRGLDGEKIDYEAQYVDELIDLIEELEEAHETA